MKILKATIVTNLGGCDKISLTTDLPTGYGDPSLTDPLYLNFEVAAGRGLEYVRAHFPDVAIETIDAKTGVSALLE